MPFLKKRSLLVFVFALLTALFVFFVPAQAQDWVMVKDGFLIAVSKAAYDKAFGLIMAKDSAGIQKMVAAGVIAETREGTEIYVERMHPTKGVAEVKLRGSQDICWIDIHAVPETVKENAPLRNEAKTQIKEPPRPPPGSYKIEGVSPENKELLVYISHGPNMKSYKVNDNVCGGKIESICLPGEKDCVAVPKKLDDQYRVKIKFAEREMIFKNGEIICGGK